MQNRHRPIVIPCAEDGPLCVLAFAIILHRLHHHLLRLHLHHRHPHAYLSMLFPAVQHADNLIHAEELPHALTIAEEFIRDSAMLARFVFRQLLPAHAALRSADSILPVRTIAGAPFRLYVLLVRLRPHVREAAFRAADPLGVKNVRRAQPHNLNLLVTALVIARWQVVVTMQVMQGVLLIVGIIRAFAITILLLAPVFITASFKRPKHANQPGGLQQAPLALPRALHQLLLHLLRRFLATQTLPAALARVTAQIAIQM